MIGRYEAYMNGIALSSIDPSICVLDIRPSAPKPVYSTYNLTYKDGAVIENAYYEKTSVEVEFEIHEYSVIRRQNICQKIQKWAKRGIFTASNRPDQRLKNCVCESFPVAESKSWTKSLTMTLSAYNPPYWEELNPTTVTLTGTDSSANVYVPGNADKAYVSADVTISSFVTSIRFTVGDTTIVLTGLSNEEGDHIRVGYDDDGYMYIRLNNTSIIEKRHESSDDDLIVECGKINTFSIASSASVSVTYTVRGCWL